MSLLDDLRVIETSQDADLKKEIYNEVINTFEEQLKLKPEFIKSVLREQKKKIEAERKRVEEFRANQAKSKVDDDEVK